MGRCVELLDDGTLLARWMLFVGPERSAGSDFNQTERYEAPVGGIEQSRMLDRFLCDLAERLPLALEVSSTAPAPRVSSSPASRRRGSARVRSSRRAP